ncbi:MAG: HAD family hydrolase [Oscillospiraceae bacterium]|nr:HAD family hydrolase [Oscillospiraceae bacterium]
MEKTLSRYLVVTDIDDTLLPHEGEIPQRNLEAIHRFQQKGGKFTFATGRSHYHCAELYRTLGINVPSAQNNGAYLYDCTTQTVLERTFVPRTANAYIKEACRAFPDMAVAVSMEDEFRAISSAQSMEKQKAYLNNRQVYNIDEIGQDWFKILFVRAPEQMDELHRWLDAHPLEGTYYTNSSAVFCEMMAKGVDKGTGLRKLARVMGVDVRDTFAIGDFYNDIDMLKAAGTSVAVGDGAQDIINMCDMVVGPCAQGAVADLIEFIERL